MTDIFSEMDFDSMLETLQESGRASASLIGGLCSCGQLREVGQVQCVDCAHNWPEDVASVKPLSQTTEAVVDADTTTIDTAVVDKWTCTVCDTENFDFDGPTCPKCGFKIDIEEPVHDSDNARKSSGYFGSKQAYKQRPMDTQSLIASKMAAASKCIAHGEDEVVTEPSRHFGSKQAMSEAALDVAATVEDSEAVIPVVGFTVTSPVTAVEATLVQATAVQVTAVQLAKVAKKPRKKPRKKPSKKRKRKVAAPNPRIPKGAKVFQQKTGKWLARMDYNGQKQKYIGRFKHEAEARAAAALCEADPAAFFEGKKSSAAAKKKPRVE
jgi:hypothetical protein|tara:strand:+ start:159 stop:1133 length:975 start_codon:yes stop_codon:yes gene_type:complete